MASRSVLVAILLLAPALAFVPAADACSVPCGRIYPQITMRVPDQAPVYNVSLGVSLELDAELTYAFDADAEGYTLATPNEPVVIRFEFPRKPKWADITVEPVSIEVPVNDPRYITADPAGGNPQAEYRYTVPIHITALVTDQAVLRDGYDFAKLLIFAKSSESGLYQAGYGIKEIRVAPEGALHESDLAGSRDVYVASALPALTIEPVESTVAGATATLAPRGETRFWEPTTFDVAFPSYRGKVALALHEESGALVSHAGPLDASTGAASFNATLVHPGLHTATVTLLPEAGGGIAPVTIPLDFVAGDLAPEGWQYPEAYVLSFGESVPTPALNQADPLAQFERDVPFFAFDKAQSISIGVTLVTPGLDALARSLANLQFSVHDPEGNLLQQASVDPTVPTKSYRVGSLPMDGWYALRLTGFGLPAGASYDVHIEGAYAQPATQRNRADGLADATPGLLGVAGRNMTLPVEALAVWAPTPLAPSVEGFDSVRYSMTIFDANGTLAYATGLRTGDATFAPASAGTFRAFVHAEAAPPSTAFSPVVRAFTFGVGNETATTASTFALEDTLDLAQAGVTPTLLGIYALPAIAGGTVDMLADRVQLRYVDLEGNELTDLSQTDGNVVLVQALGTRSDGLDASTGGISGTVSYPAPVTLVGPDVAPATPEDTRAPIPFLAAGLLLAVLGAAAVSLALVRRK